MKSGKKYVWLAQVRCNANFRIATRNTEVYVAESHNLS